MTMTNEYHGIDISKHNIVGTYDQAARAVDFVIMRAGGEFDGYYKDSRFEKHYAGFKAHNIPVGCYYDAGKSFIGAEKGNKCAEHFAALIKGKKFEYPVYLDIEVTPKKYKKHITEAVIAFCESMEELGYYAGIYASDISGFKEMLIIDDIKQFDFWVARYGKNPAYVSKYGMWQYTSKGSIPGIIGNVDRDISYKNYPKIIKGGHFNGY